jgi:DNA-directed RNA polymerase subunit E'/Rpb7
VRQYFPTPTDTDSNESEKVWVWQTGENEYWFDPGTIVRIRIEKETWRQPTDTAAISLGDNADSQARSQVSYSIEASIAEPGLGGVEWW